MAIGNRSIVSREIRTLFDVGALGNLTDGQLLERFASGPPEAAKEAFTALVERHGPMVLRVCFGILPDPHDADDAFQAVFLILWRRSRGLWVRDSIGPWLHQVAHRTAKSSRAASLRRRRLLERKGTALASRPAQHEPEPADPDVHRLIHEELARLPDRYRVPIVLCDLESHTCEQAARIMSCPVATLKTRLIRGRDRLRSSLIRRGLTPSASAELLGLLARREPLASSLLQATIVRALEASGQGTAKHVASLAVLELTRRVSRYWILQRLCLVAAVLVALASIGLGMKVITPERGSESRVAGAPKAASKPTRLALRQEPQKDQRDAAKRPKAEGRPVAEILKDAAKTVQSTEKFKQHSGVLVEIARAQFRAGDREAALETTRRATAAANILEPVQATQFITQIAWCLYEAEERKKALDLLLLSKQKALNINEVRQRTQYLRIISGTQFDLGGERPRWRPSTRSDASSPRQSRMQATQTSSIVCCCIRISSRRWSTPAEWTTPSRPSSNRGRTRDTTWDCSIVRWWEHSPRSRHSPGNLGRSSVKRIAKPGSPLWNVSSRQSSRSSSPRRNPMSTSRSQRPNSAISNWR